MAFNVTVTPQVQEVEVSATVQPYEVEIKVNDGGLKVTTNGDSGEATYDSFSGDLNIPNYSLSGLGGVPTSRTLTINGTAYDLSANRSWNIPTHDAVTIGTANGLSLAGQVLSLGLASAGVTGALSGTDWSTFNGKQNALGFTPVSESGSYANPSWITSLGWNKISSTPTTLSGYGITDAYTSGQVDTLLSAKQNTLSLTTTGSSGASTLVGSTINIPNYTLSGLGGIGGSISTGRVAFGSGANTIGGDTKFLYDSTVGKLTLRSESTEVRGFIAEQYNNGVQAAAITFQKARGAIASPANVQQNDLVGAFTFSARVGGIYTSDRALFGANMASSTGIGLFFSGGSSDGAYNPGIYIHPTNNVTIGSSQTILTGITDAGFRLDVNGTARIQGNLTTNISAGQVMFAGTAGLLSGSNNLFWDSANGRLGIGTNSPANPLSIRASGFSGFVMRIAHSNDTLNFGAGFVLQNANTGEAPTGSRGFLFNFTQQQTGVEVNRAFLWNYENGPITFGANNGERMRLFPTGNLLIQNGGTFTDAGFRLDVNGTVRVQGDLTISDTRNIILATGTGTKIGTATSQKLSLWNATPDVQPTTAITAAAFVANTSGIVDDTATFGGYTIGQIVAALKRLGALA